MADLNPSLQNDEDKEVFNNSLKELSNETYEEGIKQGDKYFFIPALNKHRGVCHFYLENYKTQNESDDFLFAQNFGEGIIDTYINIIENAFKTRTKFSVQDIKKQLDYHTLYLFQVLTLDRGTTSGLLVHNQNDIGIMGSLPSFVNKSLLKSWIQKVEKPQDELVNALVEAIKDDGMINASIKEKLASRVREHYKNHPQALKYQASGNTIPNTVNNHKN
jgi:coproporphyrinogen III oxidase